jgi:hypothetical protein
MNMADDPVDTLAGNIQYVGRGLRVEAYAGMNGDPEASSLLPGQQVRRGTVAKKIMAGTQVNVPGSNAQTRTVSAKPIKVSPTMHSPNKSTDKVPTSLNRGTVAPSVKPAKAGSFKR